MRRLRMPSVRPRRHAAAPAAWLIAATLALQSALGLALGVRMAGDLDEPSVAELCTDGGAAALDEPAGRPAAPRHDHDQCAICQGGLGPMLAAVVPAPPAPGPALHPSDVLLDAALLTPAPPLAYASRAPPPAA